MRPLVLSLVLICIAVQSSWATIDPDDPFGLHRSKSDQSDTLRYVEMGISAITHSPTSHYGRGWGGGFHVDVTRFAPVAVKLAFNWSRCDFERQYQTPVDLESATMELSVLLRDRFGRFSPYFGLGPSYVSSSAPTSGPDQFVPGGYDGLGKPSYYHDYGSGFGMHVRGGFKFHLSSVVQLFGDVRWQSVRPSVTLTFIEFPSLRTYDREVKYDFDALQISVGVSAAPKIGR